MAKHVPLGEGTVNDHEVRIERMERQIAEFKAGVLPDLTPATLDEPQSRRPGRPPKNKES